ncbi:hypothetical protein T08_15034 [Trichinella sp. T8]|nr:hypothetical protein T08_15034 [Trichinella sp. T8]
MPRDCLMVLRHLAAAFRPGGLPPAPVDDKECALGSTSLVWRRRCGWRGVPRLPEVLVRRGQHVRELPQDYRQG